MRHKQSVSQSSTHVTDLLVFQARGNAQEVFQSREGMSALRSQKPLREEPPIRRRRLAAASHRAPRDQRTGQNGGERQAAGVGQAQRPRRERKEHFSIRQRSAASDSRRKPEVQAHLSDMAPVREVLFPTGFKASGPARQRHRRRRSRWERRKRRQQRLR